MVFIEKLFRSFFLETSVKKWRDLRVEVLRVNCTKEDSEFLKFLLSSSSEQGYLKRGVFLPEGLHLIEGKELVYKILSKHNNFTQNIKIIPLSGLSTKELLSVLPRTNTTLRDTLLSIEGVISIEKLRDRFQSGLFSVITTKQKEQLVLENLESHIASFYKSQIGQRRMVMIGTKKLKTSVGNRKGVMSYAEILSTKYQSKLMAQPQLNQKNTSNSVIKPIDSTENRSTQMLDTESETKNEKIIPYRKHSKLEITLHKHFEKKLRIWN